MCENKKEKRIDGQDNDDDGDIVREDMNKRMVRENKKYTHIQTNIYIRK